MGGCVYEKEVGTELYTSPDPPRPATFLLERFTCLIMVALAFNLSAEEAEAGGSL